MGGSQSRMELDITLLNKTIVDVISVNQNTAESSAVSDQTIIIKGGKFNCQLSVGQTSEITVKTLQSIDQSTSANLVAAIMTELTTQMKNQFDQKTGFGAIPTNADLYSKSVISLENELKANLSANNINNMISKINVSQTQGISDITVDPCGYEFIEYMDKEAQKKLVESNCKKTPCDFSQISSVTILSTQITKSVLGVVAANQNYSDLKLAMENDTKITNTGPIQDLFNGLSNVISSFGMAFLGPLAGVSFCSFCSCCCLVLIVVMMGAMGGAGGGAGGEGGDMNNNGGEGGGGHMSNYMARMRGGH